MLVIRRTFIYNIYTSNYTVAVSMHSPGAPSGASWQKAAKQTVEQHTRQQNFPSGDRFRIEWAIEEPGQEQKSSIAFTGASYVGPATFVQLVGGFAFRLVRAVYQFGDSFFRSS